MAKKREREPEKHNQLKQLAQAEKKEKKDDILSKQFARAAKKDKQSAAVCRSAFNGCAFANHWSRLIDDRFVEGLRKLQCISRLHE